MSPFYVKTLTAEIDGPDGKQVFDFLRYATVDDGVLGRSTHKAFLIDTKATETQLRIGRTRCYQPVTVSLLRNVATELP